MTTNLEGVARFYLPATDAHDVKSVTSGNDLAVYSGTSFDIALDASQEGFSGLCGRPRRERTRQLRVQP